MRIQTLQFVARRLRAQERRVPGNPKLRACRPNWLDCLPLDARQDNRIRRTKTSERRSTFASVVEGLVSAVVLKRKMNHAVAVDVTLGHYVAKGDAQLRAGWRAVADWIEAEAKKCETQSKA